MFLVPSPMVNIVLLGYDGSATVAWLAVEKLALPTGG
jgi:hypothetical protein